MKLKIIALLLVLVSQLFAQQILDDGKTVYFGQNIEEVHKLFSVNPIDDPSPVARKGVDKMIQTKGVSLTFDTGKLNDIEFSKEYQFKNPTKPYGAAWKNFDPIGDKKLKANITHAEFLTYLNAWEDRAKQMGAKKVSSEDLSENEYNVSITQDRFMDSINIAMGPSRKTSGGGRWNDEWCAFFATETDHRLRGETVGALQTLSAFCDEFNTVARR